MGVELDLRPHARLDATVVDVEEPRPRHQAREIRKRRESMSRVDHVAEVEAAVLVPAALDQNHAGAGRRHRQLRDAVLHLSQRGLLFAELETLPVDLRAGGGAGGLEQAFGIGQRVRIGELEGKILELTAVSIVLETDQGRVNVPAKVYNEAPIVLIAPRGDDA